MRMSKSVLEVIKSITSDRESGRLEINSSGMYGTLLFNEGKLIDARLESLSGFQAVNAVAALRDVELNFEHVPPATHVSTITPSERVVLKRFFGIEAAGMDEQSSHAEADPDWNATPEQVVPLAAVAEIEIAETPTVEVARVPPASIPSAPSSFSWLRIGVPLALLLALTVGVIAVRSRMASSQPPASIATGVTSGTPVTKPVTTPVTPVTTPVTAVSSETTRNRTSEPRANVQDLTGEWRVINTVEKTAYKSYDNLQVGFRLVIDQQGKEFTARGEKLSENGQTLPADSRTPIRVTGSVDGDKVVATFVEDGRGRRTNGRFVWRLQNGGDALAGTFVSSAAKSSGRSAVTKRQ